MTCQTKMLQAFGGSGFTVQGFLLAELNAYLLKNSMVATSLRVIQYNLMGASQTALDIGKVDGYLFAGLALQDPQGFNHIYIPEAPGGERQIVNLKGCLPAFGRIREDIMNHQKAADHDVPGPGIIVGEHCLQGMSAVDEHQA